MVSFKQKWKVSGNTAAQVKKTVRKMAKGIGMTAKNITTEKTSLRSGGKRVFNVTALLKTRSRRKKR